MGEALVALLVLVCASIVGDFLLVRPLHSLERAHACSRLLVGWPSDLSLPACLLYFPEDPTLAAAASAAAAGVECELVVLDQLAGRPSGKVAATIMTEFLVSPVRRLDGLRPRQGHYFCLMKLDIKAAPCTWSATAICYPKRFALDGANLFGSFPFTLPVVLGMPRQGALVGSCAGGLGLLSANCRCADSVLAQPCVLQMSVAHVIRLSFPPVPSPCGPGGSPPLCAALPQRGE